MNESTTYGPLVCMFDVGAAPNPQRTAAAATVVVDMERQQQCDDTKALVKNCAQNVNQATNAGAHLWHCHGDAKQYENDRRQKLNGQTTYPQTLLAMLEQAQATNAALTAELDAMTAERDKWRRAADGWYENSRQWLRSWQVERERNAWLQDRYDRLMGWHLGDDNDNDGDE